MLDLSQHRISLRPADLSDALLTADAIWSDDVLGFEATAQTLVEIISHCTYPLTMCLNSTWGTGKTFFMRRFCAQYCKGENNTSSYQAIYFNAWEDDSVSDPLLAILGQLYKCFANDKDMKGLVVDAAKSLPKILANVGWKVWKEAHPVVGGVVDGIASACTSRSEGVLDEYLQQVASRSQLRHGLADLANKVAADTGRPLVFVIDELDRCRPLFAIEMLERVKHLFNVPNVVFLFGVDCEQLQKSICAVYGEVDAANYLHRFFDIEIKLPESDLGRFFFMLCKRHGVLDEDTAHCLRDVFPRHFLPLVKHGDMSLREMEKAFRYFVLLYVKNNAYVYHPTMLPLLIVLKIKHPEEFKRLKHRDITAAELVDTFFGALQGCEEFSECEDVVGFIYRWFVMGEINESIGARLKDAFALISKAEVCPKFDASLFAKCLRALPFEKLKSFSGSVLYFVSHGSMRDIDESVPDMIRQLDCLAC